MTKWILGLAAVLFIAYYIAGKNVPDHLHVRRITVVNAGNRATRQAFTEKEHMDAWWPKKKNSSPGPIHTLPVYNGFYFLFKEINENNISVTILNNKDSINGIIRISKLASDTTGIEWKCTLETRQNSLTNLYYYWKAQKISKITDELLLQAKLYVENSSLFYGYNIKMEKVVNSIITVSTQTTCEATMYKQVKFNFESIHSYISKNNLQATGNFMLSVTRLSKDSLRVMTGIPTNKFANPEGNINYMQLPLGGWLAATSFKGFYKDRGKVYAAMEEFTRDKELNKISQPFEILLNNQLPDSDSSVVSLKICFPVF
jgi:effector-binding domain-containing protein